MSRSATRDVRFEELTRLADYPALVEFDLMETYPAWRVRVVVAYLVGQGLRLEALAQPEVEAGDDEDEERSYRILVHADDVDAVQRGLLEADLR